MDFHTSTGISRESLAPPLPQLNVFNQSNTPRTTEPSIPKFPIQPCSVEPASQFPPALLASSNFLTARGKKERINHSLSTLFSISVKCPLEQALGGSRRKIQNRTERANFNANSIYASSPNAPLDFP